MGFLIIRSIAAIIPKRFLPIWTKMVGNECIVLNTQERREFFERNLTHRLDQLFNKYSPIRRLIKFHKEQLLKRKQNQFYCLIGQIALTHAGIEQDLKNTLMVDWDVPEIIELEGRKKDLNLLYGWKLQKEFLRTLAESLIPREFLEEYKALCDEFRMLSNKRNDALKAIYSFNQETAVVSKIYEKSHDKYDKSMTLEEMVNLWAPKVDLSGLQDLYKDLANLRQKFINVRCFIFSDKIRLHSELCSEIGKMYPISAFKNPYLYRASLEKEKTAS